MKRTDQFSAWKVISLNSPDDLSLDFTASVRVSFRLFRIEDSRAFFLKVIENNIKSGTYTAPLTGNYAIEVINMQGDLLLTGTYQSEPYSCPFPAIYTDINNVFTSCQFFPDPETYTNSHTDSQPRFVLGSLAEKDVVKIRMDFPDASGPVRTFKLKLLNAIGT